MKLAATVLVAGLVVGAPERAATPQPNAEGPHDYFDRLIARPDLFKVNGVPRAYSLRPRPGAPQTSAYWEGQLRLQRDGGYVTGSPDRPVYVTYSPKTDGDRHAQDAAKTVIPAFIPERTRLAEDVDRAARWIPIEQLKGVRGQNGRTLRVGDEFMTMAQPCRRCPILDKGRLHVTRGAFGTSPSSHRAGTPVAIGNNSLQNQVRVPINTPGGVSATYFATWDGYWTDSYLGSGLRAHKTFQFSAGGDEDPGNIWLEPRTRFDGGSPCCRPLGFNPARHVASIDVRSYNRPGGNREWRLTDGNMLGPGARRDPLQPMSGQFLVFPNRWVRFFVLFEIRVSDYDSFSLWVADESTPAVKLIDRVAVSLPNDGAAPNSIMRWWIELNTSTTEHVRPDGRDWVAYFRNFVMLKDPRDVSALLEKPVGHRTQ